MALWNKAHAEIKITKLDNGYVIEWERDKTAAEKRAQSQRMLDNWPTVRGIEIVDTDAKLLKRLKELV